MTTMTELGALLRKERELKGLSHDDVSRRIKVAIRTLVALEEGNVDDLPHLVYTKGFAKSYARLLGLDPEEVGASIDAEYAEIAADQEEAEPVYVSRRIQPERPRWPKVLAVLIFLALVAAGTWFLFLRPQVPSILTQLPLQNAAPADSQPAPVETPTVDAAPPVMVPEPVQPAAPAVSEAPAVQNESVVVPPSAEELNTAAETPAVQNEAEPAAPVLALPPEVKEQNGVGSAPAVEPVTEAVPAPAVEPVAEPVVAAPETGSHVQDVPLAAASQYKLVLTATNECWIEAGGEGIEHRALYLRPGQKFVLNFPKELTLKLGNSGGVSLMLNGRAVPFDGAEGKVMTFHFAPGR